MIFEYENEFARTHKSMNAAVFLSTGRDESQQMVQTTDKMIRTLLEKYPGLRFTSLLPEGENHRSIFPYAFSRGVRWLFKRAR